MVYYQEGGGRGRQRGTAVWLLSLDYSQEFQRGGTTITTYEQWRESLGLPVHKGYYIDDLRTIETGWWAERGCDTAFIKLGDDEIATEHRVTGIPAGKTTQPWRFALDDVFYVLEGKGLTTVWGAERRNRKTFEWQKKSLFVIPRQSFYQLTNAQGDKPATLLSYNLLPTAMRAIPDPQFFFNNPYLSSRGDGLEDFYSEAKSRLREGDDAPVLMRGRANMWYGNFFPDLGVWDKLEPFQVRGGGGHVVWIIFPNAAPPMVHMSVFPARTYKKAHTNNSSGGEVIVIPSGEGYSVMWQQGKEQERMVIPWREGSCFTPCHYHQHFNVGSAPARYLRLHSFAGGRGSRDDDPLMGQIEYPDEDPWIRQHFEEELDKRGLTSLIPEEAYKDRNYQWQYAQDKE